MRSENQFNLSHLSLYCNIVLLAKYHVISL